MAASDRDKTVAGVRLRRPSRFREFLEDTAQAAGMAEHGLEGADLGLGVPGVENKKVVVVSTEPEFAPALVSQALGVAGRLGTEVVALSVGRAGNESGNQTAAKAMELFTMRAEKSAENFGLAASEAGLAFRHVIRFGRAADVVESECGRLRRVEFVLALKEQRGRDGFHLSMPLFEVIG
jgi:hypothetical protein